MQTGLYTVVSKMHLNVRSLEKLFTLTCRPLKPDDAV